MMFNKISRFFSTGEADSDTNDDDDNNDDDNDDDDDDDDDDSVGNLFFLETRLSFEMFLFHLSPLHLT